MNRTKYWAAIFLGTFVYVLLSVSFGQNSIHCYNQMEEQKRIISKQTSEIQNINSELTLELAALKNDRAVIASYAHKLDYVSDGEKLVKSIPVFDFNTDKYITMFSKNGMVKRSLLSEFKVQRSSKPINEVQAG